MAEFIEALARLDRLKTSGDAVDESLRLLQEANARREAAIAKLNADVAVGMGELERGEVVDGPTAMRQLWDKIQRYKAAHP